MPISLLPPVRFFTCLIIVLAFTYAEAQSCFRGQSLPYCRRFPITEFGVALPRPDSPEDFYVNWQLGYMWNLNPQVGLGGSAFFGVGEEARAGIKPRFRFWVSSSIGIDLSPGLLLWDDRFGSDTPGFAGEIAISINTLFAPMLQVESVPNQFSRDTLYYPGVKAESYAGAVLGGIGAVVAAIIVIARRID